MDRRFSSSIGCQFVRSSYIFIGVFVSTLGLSYFARKSFAGADIPLLWPLGEVKPADLGDCQAGALIASIVVGFIAIVLAKRRLSPMIAVFTVVALAVASNGIPGIETGYANTINGQDVLSPQYQTDALEMADSRAFVRDFNAIQADLTTHSKTHPPGPVLLMKLGIDLGLGSAAWAVALGVISLVVLLFVLNAALSLIGIGEADRGWWLLVLGFLPAVQIYSIYSIDLTIAALAAGLVVAPRLGSIPARCGLAILSLSGCAMLTFGTMVLVALLPFLWWWHRRPIWECVAIIGSLVSAGVGVASFAGLNYWQAFSTASKLENPRGYRLFDDPVSFIATRLENIAEPILFAGPLMVTVVLIAMKDVRWRESVDARVLGALVGLIGLAFLAGAYRTGETARACLFVWPFLGVALASVAVTEIQGRNRLVLVGGLAAQTIVMQTFGMFHW